MGSGDFFLRFETAVMAKPMNDGWALAVEAAAAGGTSAAIAATRSGSSSAGISIGSAVSTGAGLAEPNCAWRCYIAWDPQRMGYYGNVFFELWIFNDTANAFQYNQRYVSLWLNMTK